MSWQSPDVPEGEGGDQPTRPAHEQHERGKTYDSVDGEGEDEIHYARWRHLTRPLGDPNCQSLANSILDEATDGARLYVGR